MNDLVGAISKHISSIRSCLLAGPGRGDCKNFLGLPKEENEHTTDVYGVPHGWCIVCWHSEQLNRLYKGAPHPETIPNLLEERGELKA